MQDFILTSQRRAQLYEWFSSLFSAPLSEADLQEFDSYDLRDFLKSLATLDPLHPAATHFQEQVSQLLQLENSQDQLADSYQALFTQTRLLDTSSFDELDQDALLLMSILLKQYGTQLADDDPLHGANQLEMMATLAFASSEQARSEADRIELLEKQRALANQLLISWLPPFSEQCQQQDTLGFYASLAQLLLAVFIMDIHYLNNVAQ